MSAHERVLAALRAARRIADPDDPLGRAARERLPASSGLSPAGVALALDEHLETHADDADLKALLDTPRYPRCHLVLAANVCTAPLRAIACAHAASSEVYVRPSRRDPVVTELLLEALDEDPAFVGAAAQVDRATPRAGDVVHVYGHDETIATYRRELPSGVTLRGHGTGLGVAVIESETDLAEAAKAFARDLVPFDGRGCLSPRVVLVSGSEARARAFAAAAHQALLALGHRVPRGPLALPDATAVRRYAATMAAIGEAFVGPHHLLGLDPEPDQSGNALPLGPAARCALVVPARLDDLSAGVHALGPRITAIGGEGPLAPLARAVGAIAPEARRSRLGLMQRPALDGPVDLRHWTSAEESPTLHGDA